jgi:4'-phosphopantetheinyl transferase
LPETDSIPPPEAELHVWRARLDCGGWPAWEGLPPAERDRATKLLRPDSRRRWVASRWALRSVLGRYLDREPAEIELRFGDRGKPMLAAPESRLRFNLSHSGELALIAVAGGCEVGVDVQLIGAKPAEFYAEWTRREAVAKCHGTGLWAPLPDTPIAVAALDAGTGFAAAIAVSGNEMPPLRHFVAEPD